MTSTDQKLLVVIVSDDDADRLIPLMVGEGFPATKISSTSGFLKKGNATILSGLEAGEVPAALALIRRECRARTETVIPPTATFPEIGLISIPVEVRVGGAIVFVLPIERFEKT